MLVNCLSKLEMLKKLDSKVVGLDVTASSFKPLFIFIDVEGNSYNCQTAQSFVQEFNKRFGETLGAATRSIGKRKFMLEFLSDEAPAKEVEAVPVEDDKDVQSEMFDIQVAKNLEEGLSKKEAKDALADYAQKFDIVLTKNKSFDNMIADLEQEVASA